MLHSAIGRGDWTEVQQLLNISYINVNELDSIGQTPLHAVSSSGQYQLAEILIQKGADVNRVDNNSWAPIHCAAANSHLDIVELLLDHPKTDVSILSKDGTSAFHYLTRFCVGAKKESEYLRVLEKAKEKGCDISLHGTHLETPLHQATARGNEIGVKFLLENNANVDAQNKFGETAIHYAVRKSDKRMIRLLLKYNPDLSVRSRDGTAHDMASEDIKCILNGDDAGDAEEPESEAESESNDTTSSHSEPNLNRNSNIDPQTKQIQEHMLAQYTAQAYKNGIPTSLPIFCKHCLRPFTYPVGAISIKCPTCLTVNEIPPK